MIRLGITTIGILISFHLRAQEEAVITSTGKTVLLFADSTWKFKPEPVDTVATDSISKPAPVVKKQFNETATGFRGFLKPELEVGKLPDMSYGVYEFRVKVNKEGFVKEVITLKRGINGDAERLMRQGISKMKFLPDGSIVPPLTEGIIKLEVSDKE